MSKLTKGKVSMDSLEEGVEGEGNQTLRQVAALRLGCLRKQNIPEYGPHGTVGGALDFKNKKQHCHRDLICQ